MPNKILYKKQALKAYLAGSKIIYDAVKVAYGPRGGNGMIHRKFSDPATTHDGVTIADSINILETDKNIGQNTAIVNIKKASSMLNKLAGDGTSSVVILQHHLELGLYKYLKRRLFTKGCNPQDLCTGLQEACEEVLSNLPALATEINDNLERLTEVATISCADKELGLLIGSMMHEIGQDGVVSTDVSMTADTNYKVIEGYSFGRGYISPTFINDAGTQECVLNDAAIITTKKTINTINDLKEAIEPLLKDKKSFLLIAHEIDDRVLKFFVDNNMMRTFKCAVVKAPSYGDGRKYTIEDIDILVKAIKVDETSSVGHADKVIVERDKTTIIGGAGSKKSVKDRVANIKSQLAKETIDSEKLRLKARIAALNGKVATLFIGGMSEIEVGQKRDRIDDAICATRSAMLEGFVAGGGITYIDLANSIKADSISKKILKKALYEPFRQLLTNSGIKPYKYIKLVGNGYGVNVLKPKQLVNMKSIGVIDPAVVIKEVVRTSVSIASTAMTMGVMIVDVKEPIREE